MDLGAVYCHFINSIRSRQKIAVDINEDVLRRRATPDVRCIVADGVDLSEIPSNSVDTVFASNLFEHFITKERV